jgi:hypothetical protein
MKHVEKDRLGRLRMPRSRGAVSGLLLIILGAWGALIPFVGPYFNFAYPPDQEWTWTAVRGWLEVLPGVATVAGGLLLIGSRNRVNAMFGGWLAALAGAWFVVGSAFAPVLRIGTVGDPVASTDAKRAFLEVSYFSGLGALIVFLGGAVLARLTARLARDVQPAEPTEFVAPAAPAEPVESAPEPSPELSSSATTTPQEEQPTPAGTESRRSRRITFRRQRASEPVGHPQ